MNFLIDCKWSITIPVVLIWSRKFYNNFILDVQTLQLPSWQIACLWVDLHTEQFPH
jgi:hypothetical protein